LHHVTLLRQLDGERFTWRARGDGDGVDDHTVRADGRVRRMRREDGAEDEPTVGGG